MRKIIEEQKDPRILQALLSQAIEFIEMQKGVIEEIQAANAQKAQSMFGLEERVKPLVRRLFAKKSEKRNEATDRPSDKSQEEALLFSQATFPTPEKRDDQCPALEEPVANHRLTETDLASESVLRGFSNPRASDWKSLEIFDESSKIQVIERSYVKEKHHRYKYKYVGDESPEKEVIVTAPGPYELLPGMSYATEFVASIVSDKYISHMPLERQTHEMESLGLKGMINSTLSRHCG